DLTTWVNEVLKKRKLSLVVDLRKSIGDGVTLITLTETLSKVILRGVKSKPDNQEDKVNNTEICVSYLDTLGVDIAGIDATDLVNGNLKSILTLVGNIKKKFDSAQSKMELIDIRVLINWRQYQFCVQSVQHHMELISEYSISNGVDQRFMWSKYSISNGAYVRVLNILWS
ncbi:hypothetical protein ACJMK2_036193, partial [Sinanodonta woodiana]